MRHAARRVSGTEQRLAMDSLSILHVSDLHRDPKNEVSNKALLLSLEQDRDRYRTEAPKIADPNLIIDPSFVRRIDQSGFIGSLYKK